MNLKSFTAGSMAEALALVKRELGPRAQILHTRSYKRGGLLGLGARTVVEITAGDAAVSTVPKKKRPMPGSNGGAGAGASTMLAAPAVATKSSLETSTAGELIRRTYAVAQAEMRSKQQKQDRDQAVAAVGVANATSVVPQRMTAAPPAPVVVATPLIAPITSPDLSDEIRAVRRMVASMMKQQRQTKKTREADLPSKLFDQYLNLLQQEVAEELADEICQQVRATLSASEVASDQAVKAAMRDALAKLVPSDAFAGRIEPTDDNRPRTIALIGPTGVGKTTTVAKLAANFKLKQKKNVGLITLDTYRIAAVDQLRTYANIIGVPLHVVATPEEMADAQRKVAGCHVVLIDTAGRSQKDDPKLDQLAKFITVANPHEVHLVLSSTCSEGVLMDTAQRFARIRTDRVLFTKLDEAVSFGVLLNVARRVNKRLSYVTTGQEVPHHIEPGRPERLAALLMGEEV